MESYVLQLIIRATVVIGGLLLLGVLLAMGQSQQRPMPKSRKWNYTAMAEVPEKARAKRNPLEGDLEAKAAGKKLFQQHCSECHGEEAGGGRRGPNLRTAAVQDATPGALFFVVSNGVVRHGMPDWSKLPEPERWQIVSFLGTLHQ